MAFNVREMAASNSILAALPPAELEWVLPYLKPLDLPVTEMIYEEGGAVDSVYFVTAGMISQVLSTTDGIQVEVGMIGVEGVAGAGPALAYAPSFTETMVQISGHGLRMPVSNFRDLFGQSATLRKGVMRHLYSITNQNAQCGVCNQMHTIVQRLARWLLTAHDRAGGTDVMDLTHEYLASMLGARRPGVTLAAGELRKAGAIDYSRGIVTVLNRQALLDCSCECYDILQRNGSS